MKKIRLLLIWLPLAVVGLFVIMLVLAPAQVVSSAAGEGLRRVVLGLATLSWIALIPCAYMYARATGWRAAGWMLGISVPLHGLR
jgi:hypothetical protein